MPRVASLDLGTNTFRLLIADRTDDGKLLPLLRKRIITRLGEGFHLNGRIQPQGVNRARTALESFAPILDEYQVEQVFAVATSVVREAENGDIVSQDLSKQSGIPIRTLTGIEEAHLTLRGVFSVLSYPAKLSLVVDIGGGSTELILSDDTTPFKTETINLGVVHLAERFLRSDPPLERDITHLHDQIRKGLSLSTIAGHLAISPLDKNSLALIATAGTVTTLAAIDQHLAAYDPAKINNYLLSRKTLQALYSRFTILSLAERAEIPGLEKGREDLIIPGTAILLEVMELFQATALTVSDAGLLEGILLEDCS
jgi:exopolyphosphatase/guanosine-5'-triphosphate,3'-diphosphate pyrophosphatase